MNHEATGDHVAPLEDILDEAIEASDGEKTSIGEIIDKLGSRSLGPVLVLFGLLALFPPIGAVPGVPIILGAVLVLFSAQFLVGRTRIWLPNNLRKRSFKRDKLEKAREKLDPWLSRIDGLFKERLTFMTGKVASRLVGVAALLHAFLMIPLEFISAVALPGVALTFFGVALMARDGLMMILGWLFTLGAVYITLFVVPWGKVIEFFT